MNKQELKEEVGKLNLVVTEFESDGMCYMDRAVSVTQVYDLIDQLDELKVLSQEWIDNNVVHIRGLGDIFEAVAVESLLVPKRELPVIPKFVADWIEEMKKDKRPFYSVMSTLMNKTNHEWVAWESANMNFSEIVAQAWLDGYEVEEEKLYYVKLPNTNSTSEYLYLAQGSVSGDYWFNSRPERLDYEANACKHKFTEKQIKDYDERYIPFMVPVDEVNND